MKEKHELGILTTLEKLLSMGKEEAGRVGRESMVVGWVPLRDGKVTAPLGNFRPWLLYSSGGFVSRRYCARKVVAGAGSTQ